MAVRSNPQGLYCGAASALMTAARRQRTAAALNSNRFEASWVKWMTSMWSSRLRGVWGSGRRAFIAEGDLSLRLRRIGRRKCVAKCEGLGCWALGSKGVEFGDCFSDAGAMACGDPPENEKGIGHAFKPFATAAHDLYMGGAVHVLVERFDIAPDGHVDEQVGIVEGANRGGIALLGLQAPDEAGCALGQGVDALEVRGEVCHEG